MTHLTPARLIAAAVLYLCGTALAAQEPLPPPPPEAPAAATEAPAAAAEESVPEAPEAAAPEDSVAPDADAVPEVPAATEAAAAPADADAVEPRPGAKRIVMLPVEFTVYQKSVSGIEAVPDWTETAKFALGDAAIKMLQQDERFQVVALPQLDGATQGLLREHVELFKIIGNTAIPLLQYGGKAWAEKKTNFDYTLGDGLGFLAEASEAEYAFLIAGAQVAQTGGAAFMEFLAAAAGAYVGGGGTFVFAGIVDLKNGDVKWFNNRSGAQVFGMTGTDLRKPETALEVVTQMFKGFPASSVVNFPPF